MIYFDNSATTKIDPQALQSYVQVSEQFWGNPSSLHRLGVKADTVLIKAREQIATSLQVHPEEIFFTSGGTESDNWAVKGTALEKHIYGKHLITTRIEHPALIQTMKQLEGLGFEVTYLEVNQEGKISLEDLCQALRKDTVLVSVMAVNNEVGSVQPIKEIAEILLEYPWVHFHVDAVQAFEQVPELLSYSRVDLLSLSAHKFHGPRGVGILFKRKGRKLQPLLTGGGQESNQRSTTENLPGIVATAKALRLSLEEPNSTQILRDYLWEYLAQQESVQLFSPKDGAAHILCFALRGVRGEVLVHALEEKEIYVSTTSACSSKKGDESSTLMAMQVSEQWARGAIRVSFSNHNTLQEVQQFIKVFDELIKKFSFFK